MEHLTPHQVARAIGVSAASLKRWCDKGAIPVVRTAGGHRRLPLPGVLRFLRESGHCLVRPEILKLPPNTGAGRTVMCRAVRQLTAALLAADDPQVQRILFDLYLARLSVADICDQVITPAFACIGQRVSAGEIPAYRASLASEICNCILRRLGVALEPPPRDAPYAFGATLAGDPQALPTTMAAVALRESGWRAESLGPGLAAGEWITAMRDTRPALAWVAVASGGNAQAALAACREIRAAASRRRVQLAFIAPGQAAARPPADGVACCDGMRALVELAAALRSAPSRPPSVA